MFDGIRKNFDKHILFNRIRKTFFFMNSVNSKFNVVSIWPSEWRVSETSNVYTVPIVHENRKVFQTSVLLFHDTEGKISLLIC